MANRWWISAAAVGLAACLAIGLTGCGDGSSPSSAASEESIPDLSVPPILEFDLASLLTTEQVAQAVGQEVEPPQLMENGTRVQYAAVDGGLLVDLYVEEATRELYDTQAAFIRESFPDDCQEAQNLGEAALWNRQTGELMVYGQGYLVGVYLQKGEDGTVTDADLTTCRQLAALLLEKL